MFARRFALDERAQQDGLDFTVSQFRSFCEAIFSMNLLSFACMGWADFTVSLAIFNFRRLPYFLFAGEADRLGAEVGILGAEIAAGGNHARFAVLAFGDGDGDVLGSSQDVPDPVTGVEPDSLLGIGLYLRLCTGGNQSSAKGRLCEVWRSPRFEIRARGTLILG